ncbi:MAG TPA: hypothetical protein VK206_28240, partial [Anaerolineales bacterium]|nr:hypothetical protein [Anaerolineales bacterium]
GDFNIPRGSKLYRDFLANSGLTDPMAGDTRPTHRLPSWIPTQYSLAIDYALLRTPNNQSLKVDCDLCFSNKYHISNWHQNHLSDHNGIEIHITTN